MTIEYKIPLYISKKSAEELVNFLNKTFGDYMVAYTTDYTTDELVNFNYVVHIKCTKELNASEIFTLGVLAGQFLDSD